MGQIENQDIEIELMNQAVTIDNFIYLIENEAVENENVKEWVEYAKETVEDYIETHPDYKNQSKETKRTFIKENIHSCDFLRLIKRFYLDAIARRESGFSKKIDSITSFYKLNNHEREFFLHFSLLCQEKDWIHHGLLEDRYNMSKKLCEKIALFLDHETSIVEKYIFDQNSFLNMNLIMLGGSDARPRNVINYYLFGGIETEFLRYIFSHDERITSNDHFRFALEKDSLIGDLFSVNKRGSIYFNLGSAQFERNYIQKYAKDQNLEFSCIQIKHDLRALEIEKSAVALQAIAELTFENHIFMVEIEPEILEKDVGGYLLKIFKTAIKNRRNRLVFTFSNRRNFSPVLNNLIELANLSCIQTLAPLNLKKKVLEGVLGKALNQSSIILAPLNFSHLEQLDGLFLNESTLREILSEKLGLESISPKNSFRNESSSNFYNTNIETPKIKEVFLNFMNEKIDFGKKRLAFLFSGPSGCGKSYLAESLCIELGLSFKKVSVAEIGSKYIHETEINLKKIFEENSSKNVLIFNEIDSLIPNRESLEKEWSISEVNEFLNCLDNFQGIVIGTTNLPKHIDPAAQRRFDFKIQFEHLSSSQISEMSQIYFGKFIHDEKSLEKIKYSLAQLKSVTPDVIVNTARQCLYLGERHPSEIIKRAQENCIAKNGSINLIKMNKTKDLCPEISC